MGPRWFSRHGFEIVFLVCRGSPKTAMVVFLGSEGKKRHGFKMVLFLIFRFYSLVLSSKNQLAIVRRHSQHVGTRNTTPADCRRSETLSPSPIALRAHPAIGRRAYLIFRPLSYNVAPLHGPRTLDRQPRQSSLPNCRPKLHPSSLTKAPPSLVG